MKISIPLFKFITTFTRDEGLTKKASLNAITSSLEYITQLLVSFLITPWVVSGLGNYNFGIWQILNRLIGYLAPTSGRPTQALKWTLANQQASDDFDRKRTSVGSTIVVFLLFLPVLGMLGGILTWYAPIWLETPVEIYWQVRVTAAVLITNVIAINFSGVPQSVLQGENLGYKRMGISPLLIILGGMLTWLVIQLGIGLVGLAVVALLVKLIGGIIFFFVMRKYTPWFGIKWPTTSDVKRFFNLSGWFLAWDVVLTLLVASDVVLLGILNTVESVTTYTLTKYAPETLISVIAIIMVGIAPGLGGILGSGDLKKAAKLRGEIMAITWLVITVFGSSILLLNRTFIGLWVDVSHYAGRIPTLLIVIVVSQYAFIQNDANIIDLTLKLRNKVLLGALAVVLTLVIAPFFISGFDLGIVGMLLGLIVGRVILSVSYPLIVGRHMGISFYQQVSRIFRPTLITVLLYTVASLMDTMVASLVGGSKVSWILFIILAGISVLLFFPLAFYIGLTPPQRKAILRRVKVLLPRATDY